MQPIDIVGIGVVALLAIVAVLALRYLPKPEAAPRRAQAAPDTLPHALPALAAAGRPLTFAKILGAVILGNLITGIAATLLYLLITAK